MTTADRKRLGKLPDRVGSDRTGERNAAGLATDQFIQRDALVPQSQKREPLHSTWRTTGAELRKYPGDLRPWERKFVADLPVFLRISSKQRYILSEIADRVLKRHAA